MRPSVKNRAGWTLISLCLVIMALTTMAFATALEAAGPGMDHKALAPPPPPPPPPGTPRCTYPDPWFPYWPGHNDLPQARLRVLANGEEIVDLGFCANPLWVWMGELREAVHDAIVNSVPETVCTPFGRYTVSGPSLSSVPFDTLLFSMEFRDGSDLELIALTHDLAGSVHVNGEVEYNVGTSFSASHACHVTCNCFDSHLGYAYGDVGLDAPTLFADGVYKPFAGVIDDWAVEWPRAGFDWSDLNVILDDLSLTCAALTEELLPCLVMPNVVASLVARNVGGTLVEQKAFDKAREVIEERLDPNDALSSFLGPSSEILSAIQQAAAALGITLPSPPCGTRFTVYFKNPSPDGSSGGEVTIALFAPV